MLFSIFVTIRCVKMLIDIYFCFRIMADEAGTAHIFATLIYFNIVNILLPLLVREDKERYF